MDSFRFGWSVLDNGNMSSSRRDRERERGRGGEGVTWIIPGCSSYYLKPVEGVCKIHVAINHCSCSNHRGPLVKLQKNIIDSFVTEGQWIPAKKSDGCFNSQEIQLQRQSVKVFNMVYWSRNHLLDASVLRPWDQFCCCWKHGKENMILLSLCDLFILPSNWDA